MIFDMGLTHLGLEASIYYTPFCITELNLDGSPESYQFATEVIKKEYIGI